MKDRLKEIESQIHSAYAQRDAQGKPDLYAWHRHEVTYIYYRVKETWVKALKSAGFKDISHLDILDVGCGSGGWIRMLMEWGATPSQLHGVDLLEDRIVKGKGLSPSDIDFRVNNGWVLPYENASMDLCAASTVFSSILDEGARKALAQEMTRVLKPNGWIMIFDYAISDPRNPDTIGIGRREILRLFRKLKLLRTYRLILAPPVLRIMPVKLLWLAHALEVLLPFLCTHRLYVLLK